MINRYFHDKIGYNPFLIEDNWQVAQLNYLPLHGMDDIDEIEIHKQTDEVFVLTKGTGVLIAAKVSDERMDFECIKMEQGVTYNVTAGTWHNIAMDKEASIIIVEKSMTHENDCEYVSLNQSARALLYKEIRKQLK